jgi:hypothetical protein
MPFTDVDGVSPPRLQLEQVSPSSFCVVHGFTYQVPDSPPGDQGYTVPEKQTTDLASVPFFLAWFVRSYGRHTLAAVLHDYLWRKRRDDVPLARANHIFRIAMYELKVPLIRRWIMWTAVSLAMLTMRGRAGKIRVGAWIAAILGLDVITLWVAVAGGKTVLAVLAGVFLVVSLILLLPNYAVIAVGVPTLFALLPAILLVVVTIGLYTLADVLAYLGGKLWRVLAPFFRQPVPPPMNRPVIDKTKLQRTEG